MTKLIFLDIDGVLNCNDTINKPRWKDNEEGQKNYFLDEDLIQLLNYVIKRTGAKVVVSSTWRKLYEQEHLQTILEDYGFEGEIIGMTGACCSGIRGVEILNYVKENDGQLGHYSDFNSYVILDDDSDMLIWQKDNFVNTDGRVGLAKHHVYKAINILNKEK